MGTPRHIVDKERIVGCGCIQIPHMFNRLIGQVGCQIVTRIIYKRKDLRVIAEKVWRPLIGLTAHESIEILEAHTRGPLVERSGNTVLKVWCIVVLAKPGSGITIVLKNGTDAGIVQSDDRIITRITGGQFANHPTANRMMISTGYQSSPGG
jgi:hypothetical protein